jgi:hypothetical protein
VCTKPTHVAGSRPTSRLGSRRTLAEAQSPVFLTVLVGTRATGCGTLGLLSCRFRLPVTALLLVACSTAGAEIALSEDDVALAGPQSTPFSQLCGSLPQPLSAPGSWYSSECGRDQAGRYLWLRNNATANVTCPLSADGPDFGSPACRSIPSPAVTVAEVTAYVRQCPSLHSWVDLNTSELVGITPDGCGQPALLADSAAVESSVCQQVYSGSRLFGGYNGTSPLQLRCAGGEWVRNDTGVAAGPAVVGNVCAPIGQPAWTNASRCYHVVLQTDFDGSTARALRDWYPTWRVLKVGSAAPLPLSAMEQRAVKSGGVLTLRGRRTLFALNDPLWASAPELRGTTSTLQVDVTAGGSGQSDIGLVAGIQPGTEPVSFYLLRLSGGGRDHSLLRVVAGVETVLATIPASACNLSTTVSRRVLLYMSSSPGGPFLSASCGVNESVMMTIVDTSRAALVPTGTFGLYHDNPWQFVNASGIFDNLLAVRGCRSAVCVLALPGESCGGHCAFSQNSHGPTATCQSNGSWSQWTRSCPPPPSGKCSGTARRMKPNAASWQADFPPQRPHHISLELSCGCLVLNTGLLPSGM